MRRNRTRPALAGGISLLVSAGLAAPVVAPAPVMSQTNRLAVGDRAPSFPTPLPSTGGERPGAVQVALEDVLGEKNIVLAFYVADWTGG